MLKSKFSKKSSDFKAQKLFTDRVEPTAVFEQSIQTINEKAQEILVYYGKGGIGKTSLLKKLTAKVPKDCSFHSVFISLEAYLFESKVEC